MNSTDRIPALRRAWLEQASQLAFDHGRLRAEPRDPGHFFGVIYPETRIALLLIAEAAAGHPQSDAWLADALASLEAIAARFTPLGVIGTINDLNSVSFGLVYFTEALLLLRGRAPESRLAPLRDAAVRLFDDAAIHINQTTDYLNPRGMDALTAVNLFTLTGETRFRDKALYWLDELVVRQYACGAQPYHTGGWIWGRKPAQAYQLLTATMMLAAGRRLARPDAEEYVRRLMDFERLACTRRGEPFITLFEGLHKSHSDSCFEWLWPLAAALGDARFQPLGRAAFDHWVPAAGWAGHGSLAPLGGFVNALLLGVERAPACAEPFAPPAGLHACPDISAIFIHEPERDVGLSLLTGYSSIAEADAGNVKLYALLPELTDNPTYRHVGLDAVRVNWRIPSEQDACRIEGNRAILRGRGFTKWINAEGNGDPELNLHTRELEIGLEYENGILTLEYRTLRNKHPEPIPSRLLFLLIARPRSASPALRIGRDTWTPPAADAPTPWLREAPVRPVVFAAPDGSAIEIAPEKCRAERVTAERPTPRSRAENAIMSAAFKPANEGSLRLAFEGPAVLDEGRYVIRFRP